MSRFLIWSVLFHLAVVLGGLSLAPMGSLLGSTPRPEVMISVGLVDMPSSRAKKVPVPRLNTPAPAADADIALKPVSELTKEDVPRKKEPPKKKKQKKTKPAKPRTGKQEEGRNRPSGRGTVAQADTTAPMVGTIATGTSEENVWGVETDATVSPYHRRGFAAIRSNWRNPAVGPAPRKCTVRFRVRRSGELTDIKLEQSSGSALFDRSALRAVQMTRTWGEFPQFWKEDEQIIYLDFEYRP